MNWRLLAIFILAVLAVPGLVAFLLIWLEVLAVPGLVAFLLIELAVLTGAGLVVFLLIWNFLAPSNRFFTFVKEGTAKIVVRGDKFEKTLIQWVGRTFDYEREGLEKWNVIEESGEKTEPYHLFGGLRLYGIWPIFDILIYKLRWHDLQRMEEKEGRAERPVFHEEILDYVLLRPDVYWTKLFRAETGGAEGRPERVPIDVEFLTTMRVKNPYKATFVAPIGWVENVLLRLEPIYRGFIANRGLDQLLAMRGSTAIWNELIREEDFMSAKEFIENKWGIEILENGVQIKDIGIPLEYQKEATLKWQAERERERTVIGADAQKQRIETVYQAVQKFGDLGRLVRTLEAMEESPKAGTRWVIPLPGGAEFFRDIFGRSPESLTREEITELRKLVERASRERGGGSTPRRSST